jgi:DNA-directed RNA polymerase specialized sigma subunit
MAVIERDGEETKAPAERYLILREVYRHYLDFEDYWRRTGRESITHKGVTINFMDLKTGVDKLSGRKQQAFYLNVIRDMKQKDVALRMGITTVSVGQYVAEACRQLALVYWRDDFDTTKSPSQDT